MTIETQEAEILTCSCCGHFLRDNEDENTDFGKHSFDTGFGMCVSCGGDKKATGQTEAQIRKRLGWASETFYDTRIERLQKSLTGERLERFNALSYGQKIVMVGKMVRQGMMI